MLVVARRPGEVLKIDKETYIVVLETTQGRVRLGIEAPRSVIVTRLDRMPKKKES